MNFKVAVAAIVLLVAGCMLLTWIFNSNMPSGDDVESAQRAARVTHSQLEVSAQQPLLAPLPNTWMRLQDSLSACAVAVTAAPVKEGDAGTPHWDAMVEGRTGAVLTCLTAAAQALPIEVDEMHINGDKSLVAVRLYGIVQVALPVKAR